MKATGSKYHYFWRPHQRDGVHVLKEGCQIGGREGVGGALLEGPAPYGVQVNRTKS